MQDPVPGFGEEADDSTVCVPGLNGRSMGLYFNQKGEIREHFMAHMDDLHLYPARLWNSIFAAKSRLDSNRCYVRIA